MSGRTPRRIFVQHSGYDLRNTGDSAMLQACVRRLQRRWPDAEIVIICYDADELAALLPGTVPLGPTARHLPVLRSMPRKVKLGSEHAYQALSPLVPGRPQQHRPHRARPLPRTVRAAVASSDVVVATGGGYVCDTFWWHAFGVLSCLHQAHQEGRPTGLFGQGIGPLDNPAWRRLAAPALRHVDALTLREGLRGPSLLRDLGVWQADEAALASEGVVTTRRGTLAAVTGDDALAVALEAAPAPQPDQGQRPVIGVNVRLGIDSGIGGAPDLGRTLWEAARALGADLVTVPVSYYEVSPDERSIRTTLGTAPDGCEQVQLTTGDTRRPDALARTAAGCQVVVTGSYHAAVFALAAGTPVIGLVANGYYTYKFGGLADLYPGLVTPVRLDEPDLAGRLVGALEAAWTLPAATRDDARERTRAYVARAQQAFDAWADRVEARL